MRDWEFVGTLAVASWLPARLPHRIRKMSRGQRSPLAEQARIQGDVQLEIKSGVVKILSGHPLLSQTPSKARRISSRFCLGEILM